jgi:hypothetical protein
MVDIAERLVRRHLAGKNHQLFDHFARVQRRVDDAVEILLHLVGHARAILCQLGKSEHAAERLVQLVGRARGQLADRG